MTPHDGTTDGHDRGLEDESAVGGEFLVNEPTDPARSEEPTRGAIWPSGPRQVDGPEVGPSAGIGLAGLAMCAALSLLMGGAGAWAYTSFLAPRPPVAESAASATDEATGQAATALAARLDDLSERVEGLRRDQDAKVTSPMPDFGPLMERVDKVEAATSAVDSLARKLDEIPAEVDANRREIKANRESLDEVRGLVAELQKSSTSARADGGTAPESVGGGVPRPKARPTRRSSPAWRISGSVDIARPSTPSRA
ncbi:hypothetical protein [Planctomyces sp. SH-PL62]|uniref:hypothetical protein n=1 Tax=Planctomyces sp. SH-PL62 TaxID=1636152 RepID=UPI00078C0C3F|nr:hypothetical protein [Planctomyces sp. SH-PL62]AMV35845.1 hypothetical protein VT85_00275 [Planctomyces sp. SH-PL62]